MPEVEVRAELPSSPTDSVQPVSMSDMLSGSVLELAPIEGDDFQSLLLLLPGVVRGPDGRLRIKGGPAHPGRAADQQRQPHRSLVRRFRSRSARPERRIGRSARQSVRRRVRTLFDQRHADSNPAGHQRLGDQARQSRARGSGKAFSRHSRVRAALLGPRPAQARPRVPRAGLSVPLCRDAGEEPARRAGITLQELRFVHAHRHRHLGAAHARRRADRVSARGRARHDEHVPAAGGDAGLQPERLVDRARRSVGARARRRSSKPRCRAAGSRSTSTPTAGRRWCTRRRRRAAASSTIRNAKSTACSGSRRSACRATGAAQHVFKFGTDLQRSQFNGFSASRPVEIRRLDGSLAELTVFGDRTEQEVSGVEFAAVRAGPLARRLAADVRARPAHGSRRDRRARELVASRRRCDRRRCPRDARSCAAASANSCSARRSTSRRFRRSRRGRSRGSHPTAPRSAAHHVRQRPRSDLHTPEAFVGNVEWNQRFGRRLLFKLGVPAAPGRARVHPDAGRGRAASCVCRAPARPATGSSKRRRGIWAASGGISPSPTCGRKGTADLNNYDQFFGNLRNPILRAQREQPDSDRRPASAAASRHSRAAGQVGLLAAAGAAIGFPVVGGRRVPRLRRSAQPHRAPARGSHARFHAVAAMAVQGSASVQA